MIMGLGVDDAREDVQEEEGLVVQKCELTSLLLKLFPRYLVVSGDAADELEDVCACGSFYGDTTFCYVFT